MCFALLFIRREVRDNHTLLPKFALMEFSEIRLRQESYSRLYEP